MPNLTVDSGSAHLVIPFSPGVSVREALESAGLAIRTGCRGNGACGLCLVQVAAGDGGVPTKTESMILPPRQLAGGFRLACQLLPNADLQIRIMNGATASAWRDLVPDCPYAPAAPQPWTGNALGGGTCALAVDLGTTQISLSLWDLKHGQRLYGRAGPNPQSCYGEDVVTRLMAATEAPENAWQLARLPLQAVAEALRHLLEGDGLRPQEIGRVAVVGNTAMLTLLTGGDPQLLLQPDNWKRTFAIAVEPQTWVRTLGIHPQARVEMVAPVGGFIGSDLLAGVLATGLTKQPGSLLLDFGTNSEMALWDGETLWVTSAAGGPAFEGCGMQCGMPAGPGAIYRFTPQGDGGLDYRVLGESEARGFCGSGLVDLIACLRDRGELTRTGAFATPQQRGGYAILAEPAIGLTKRDVDIFQRAKAAIGAGIDALLSQARLRAAELQRVCVAGVFGRNLQIGNAQRVGLLPEIPPERVELCGNTALAGCEWLLLSPAKTVELDGLRKRIAMVSLSQIPDFDRRFLENLYLQPRNGEGT
jgi:uncharacterized 2Fe-2S/4Fe-4S cluster protein (DUF4445 family)